MGLPGERVAPTQFVPLADPPPRAIPGQALLLRDRGPRCRDLPHIFAPLALSLREGIFGLDMLPLALAIPRPKGDSIAAFSTLGNIEFFHGVILFTSFVQKPASLPVSAYAADRALALRPPTEWPIIAHQTTAAQFRVACTKVADRKSVV